MTRSLVVLIVGRATGAVLQATLFALYARSVPIAEFGLASVMLALSMYLSVVGDLGLSTFIIREHSRDSTSGDTAGALKVNDFSSAVVAVSGTVLFAAYLWRDGTSFSLALLAVWAALEKGTETRLGIALAESRTVVVATAVITRRAVSLILFILLVSAGSAATIVLVVALLGGGLVGQLFTRLFTQIVEREQVSSLPVILRLSRPFWLTNLAVQVRALDVLVMGLFGGSVVAGLLGGANRAVAPIFLVTSSISSVALPFSLRASPNRLRRFAIKILVLAMVTVLVSVAIRPFASKLLSLTLGQSFAPAGSAFVVLVCGATFVGLSSPLESLVQGMGDERYVARASMVYALTFMVAIVIGAVLFSLDGLAVFGAATQLVYLIFVVRRVWVLTKG